MVGVSRDLNENYVVSLCDLFNRALNEFKPMPVNGETMVGFCYTEPILGYKIVGRIPTNLFVG